MNPPTYKWRGHEYLLLKDLVERYGPSIRARWGKVPENLRLVLTGENKDFFCESHDLEHRTSKIALLRNTETAWFTLVGIPRTEEAKELCRKLKDLSFDFFWFGARQKELAEKIKELQKKKNRKTKYLSRLLTQLEELQKKEEKFYPEQ